MALYKAIVLAALSAVLMLATGCASQQRPPEGSSIESIERPARPISEEESLSDKIGEAGVAVLVVTVILAVIILPIIFLGGLI